MKTPSDYDQIAEEVRRILLKRLGQPRGSRFAIIVLSALIRDDKLHELLLDRED